MGSSGQPANKVSVIKLETLPTADLEPLMGESRAQGFEFLDRLLTEYRSGLNRFSGPTEALFGVYFSPLNFENTDKHGLRATLADFESNKASRRDHPCQSVSQKLLQRPAGAEMIAIGGLNTDPYQQADDVGRVRHVYVLDAWRNQGIGTRLMRRIIKEARPHYRLLTMRTFSEQADGFYRALGFRATEEVETATHCLELS